MSVRFVGERSPVAPCQASVYTRRSLPAREGSQVTDKQRVVEAVRNLPEDATLEDAIERLCFLAKVGAGLRELDAGQGRPHSEVKRKLAGG